MHKKLAFLLIIMSGLLLSCDANFVYDEYKSVGDKWHKDSIVEFKVNKLDTLKSYDLFINLRNNQDYGFNNLYLITKMNFPNGKVISDTLEYEMAHPDGKLMGTGFGSVKENKLWYKEDVRFPEEGEYTFSIQQAMRKNGAVDPIETLSGITEVGFRIEKSN